MVKGDQLARHEEGANTAEGFKHHRPARTTCSRERMCCLLSSHGLVCMSHGLVCDLIDVCVLCRMGLKGVFPNIKGALSFDSFNSAVSWLRDNVGDAGIYDYSLEAYRHGSNNIPGQVGTIMRIVAVRFVRPISCLHPCLAPMPDVPCFAICVFY